MAENLKKYQIPFQYEIDLCENYISKLEREMKVRENIINSIKFSASKDKPLTCYQELDVILQEKEIFKCNVEIGMKKRKIDNLKEFLDKNPK